MNAKAANKKQTTISAANNWIYPQQVESRDRGGLRNWKGMRDLCWPRAEYNPHSTHTHRHTPTDRHIVCLCTNLINRIMYTYMQKLLQLDVCLCASAVASVVVYLHMCESGSSSTLTCKLYLGKIILTKHLKNTFSLNRVPLRVCFEFFLIL